MLITPHGIKSSTAWDEAFILFRRFHANDPDGAAITALLLCIRMVMYFEELRAAIGNEPWQVQLIDTDGLWEVTAPQTLLTGTDAIFDSDERVAGGAR